eukprot:s327_g9.t1
MSGQPSPDGSPSVAQAEGQAAMLAFRMIQAAEAAATAAQAATQAVQAVTSTGAGGHADVGVKPDWYKAQT